MRHLYNQQTSLESPQTYAQTFHICHTVQHHSPCWRCIFKNVFYVFEFQQTFHISRKTYQDFNKQLVAMVSCLWNSKSFLPGSTNEIDEDLLIQSKVPNYWSRFDLVHHPAFFKYAIEFHQKVSMWLTFGKSKIKKLNH